MYKDAKQDRSCEYPLVSIIIPCFNDLDTLSVALASLIAQSFKDWECILVDDGSDSPIEHVTQHFSDARIRLIKLHQNYGRSIARNRALDEACGKYVCFLDADDWYYPNKLEFQFDFMERNEYIAACATDISFANHHDEIIGVKKKQNYEISIMNASTRKWYLGFCFASVMLRHDVIGEDRFDPCLDRGEDSDFLTKVLSGRQYAILPYVCYVYRHGFSEKFFEDALHGHRCKRKVLANRFRQARVNCSLAYAETVAKTAVYKAIFWFGMGQWIIDQGLLPRNRRAPSYEEEVSFQEAKKTVYHVMNASGAID